MRREVMTFNHAARNPARGFLWLLGGCFLLLLCIFLPSIPIVDDYLELRVVAGLLSVAAVLFGLGMLLIRQGTCIDRRRGVVETWNGLVFCARRHRYPIDSFFEVALTRLAMEGEYKTHVFYNILLISSAPRLVVTQEKEYAKARHIAERVAAYLDLSLRDNAREQVYRKAGSADDVRASGALEATLGEQATADGHAPTSFPSAPEGCRIRLERGRDRVVFELPVRHSSMGCAVAISGLAVLAAAGIFWIFSQYLAPDGFLGTQIFLLALPGALAILVPAGTIYNALKYRRRQETITMTPLALSSKTRNSWFANEEVMPVERIEAFGFTRSAVDRKGVYRLPAGRQRDMPDPALIAHTNFKTMEFGRWLRYDEQVWLHDALRHLLIQAQRQAGSS